MKIPSCLTIKHFYLGTPPDVYDIALQIDIRVKDARWKCKVMYVLLARNKLARFLARLGYEMGNMIYTFNRPVRGVDELLNWDMGLGVDHPDFQDVFLPSEARDRCDFDVVLNFSDQIQDLGLG